MITIGNEAEMQRFGERLGRELHGGEVIELVGDVGAGKTTLVRGLARGMEIDETVQSPSFTINRVYESTDGRRLVHYDFYRLSDPGIMADELHETLAESGTVVVIEWADAVERIMPVDRLTIHIIAPSPDSRQLSVVAGGKVSQGILEKLI